VKKKENGGNYARKDQKKPAEEETDVLLDPISTFALNLFGGRALLFLALLLFGGQALPFFALALFSS
jgi:hypothetical protein